MQEKFEKRIFYVKNHHHPNFFFQFSPKMLLPTLMIYLVIIFLDIEILWCFPIWVPFGEVKKEGCTMEAAGKSAWV